MVVGAAAAKRLAAQQKARSSKPKPSKHKDDRFPRARDTKIRRGCNYKTEHYHRHLLGHASILLCFDYDHKFPALMVAVLSESLEQLLRRTHKVLFIQLGEFPIQPHAALRCHFG